jgi:hypothetical protein
MKARKGIQTELEYPYESYLNINTAAVNLFY